MDDIKRERRIPEDECSGAPEVHQEREAIELSARSHYPPEAV